MVSIFKEHKNKYPSFLSFSLEEVVTDLDTNLLCFLRLQLIRARTGMSDYIVRVSTPNLDGSQATKISIRGGKAMAKSEGIQKLVSIIKEEMIQRQDKTFNWEALDQKHLLEMLLNQIKFFSINLNVDEIMFTTEALVEETKHEQS